METYCVSSKNTANENSSATEATQISSMLLPNYAICATFITKKELYNLNNI